MTRPIPELIAMLESHKRYGTPMTKDFFDEIIAALRQAERAMP